MVLALAIPVGLLGLYFLLSASGALVYLREAGALRQKILSLGYWGPLSVVTLMVLAIVLSPLPSAPIALAAGTIYGHTLGTIYVLIGAELGALVAFAIARFAGRALVGPLLGGSAFARLEGSQGTMMGIVFVTRLMPFVSFDAVSYAAGLTPLSFWRFAFATLAGILPASFLLAHFGAELTSADSERIEFALLVLGLGVLVPLLVRLIRHWREG